MRDAIRSFLSRHSEIALVGEAVDFSQTIGMVCDLSRWTGPRGVEHHELIPSSELRRPYLCGLPGALVGISMIFSGISRLMPSLAARRVMDKLA